MWHTHWRLRADPGLPAQLTALLDDHFNAWQGDAALPQEPLASVGLLDAHAVQALQDMAEVTVHALPGAWPGPPVHRLVLTSSHWALRCADSVCWVTPGQGARHALRCWGPDAAMPLLLALTELFRADGWLTVHASAYQTDLGHTHVCLGRSGAGKSVRVLAQVAAGARFIGEDRLWLRASDMTVVPRDRRVRLLPRGAGVLPGLPLDRATRDADGKWRLPLDLLGLAPAQPGPLHALDVLLGQRDGDPLYPAAGTGAASRHLTVLQAVWEALGTPFLAAAQAHTSAVVQRLMKRPAHVWWRTPAGVMQRA